MSRREISEVAFHRVRKVKQLDLMKPMNAYQQQWSARGTVEISRGVQTTVTRFPNDFSKSWRAVVGRIHDLKT